MTLSKADSAQTRLMALTATVVAVVWAAMALFALAAARDSFVETHTATAQTIARATAYDVAAAMAADRMALDAAVARVHDAVRDAALAYDAGLLRLERRRGHLEDLFAPTAA